MPKLISIGRPVSVILSGKVPATVTELALTHWTYQENGIQCSIAPGELQQSLSPEYDQMVGNRTLIKAADIPDSLKAKLAEIEDEIGAIIARRIVS